MVVGPVVDEEQDRGGGQAGDQTIEKALSLGIDPVKVLHRDDKRLHPTLPQEEALHGGQRAMTALRRIERLP